MVAFGLESTLQLQESTGLAGFALQNGTPTILSWTAPNDGQMHRVMVLATLDVSSAETGGAIGVTFTDPAGNALAGANVIGAGKGAGVVAPNPGVTGMLIKGGTTVSLVQSTALTVGAAMLYGEIWGQ